MIKQTNQPWRSLLWLVIIAALIAGCGDQASEPANELTPFPVEEVEDAAALGPAANLAFGCVDEYRPGVDYFPNKASLEYAEGLTVEYFDNYKVISVLNPWRNADVTFRYVLVQCGTPAPAGFDDALLVEVPVNSIVAMETTTLPHLVALGVEGRLVGVGDFAYVNTPEVRAMIDAGEVTEVGSGPGVNVERLLNLEPELIITSGLGDPQNDAHPKLLEAGLTVAIDASHMESSPLGRAEWVKFIAAFFNQEALAETGFVATATQYNDLAARAGNVAERPTVFMNAPFQGTWYVPGGNSYQAQLLRDAGADYLWADDPEVGGAPLSFETVIDRAAGADFWINTGTWSSLDEALAADERFATFAAVQNRNVYNNNARLNASGGNDYWERGVANPHLVLADLIAIFHPDLLPDHERSFYRRLE